MSILKIKMEIIKLPVSAVLGAYEAHCASVLGPLTGTSADQKSKAADALAVNIQNGTLSIADIRSSNPVAPSAPTDLGAINREDWLASAVSELRPIFEIVGTDKALLDAVHAVAVRASNDALLGLDKINKQGTYLLAQVIDLEADIEANRQAIDRLSASTVDDRKVAADVAAAIDKAFAPFKQAVIDAGAETIIANGVSAKIVGTATALNVFGVDVLDSKGDPLLVDIWDAVDAPAVDPNFVWSERILKHLLLSQGTGENLWFGGEKGTGKSETARQFAAKTGRSYTRINFHKYTTTEDYAGCVGLENGATVFKRGAFLTAFSSPSTVVLLDEISNCDAGELATLNGFLEPNSAVNFGGQVHRRASGVLVFAADNTLTNGDQSGRYAGTRQMNSALADRFARVIRFEYLPRDDEIAALVNHTQCNPYLAAHVMDAITAARAKVETGDVIDAPSIRSAIAFIRALRVLTVDEAWASAVTSRQPSESAAGLDAIKAAYLNESQIQRWL